MEKHLTDYVVLVNDTQQQYNDGLITIDEAVTTVVHAALNLGVGTGIFVKDEQPVSKTIAC